MLYTTSIDCIGNIGTAKSAEPTSDHEANDMFLAASLEVSDSGRTRAGCGRQATDGQLVDGEAIDEEGAGDGEAWVADMECKKEKSGAICVSLIETKKRKSVEEG